MTRKLPTLKFKSNNSYNPNNKKNKKKDEKWWDSSRGKLNSQSTLIQGQSSFIKLTNLYMHYKLKKKTQNIILQQQNSGNSNSQGKRNTVGVSGEFELSESSYPSPSYRGSTVKAIFKIIR